MAKTTKSQRQALHALDDAAGAAKTARKVAKDLTADQARELQKAAATAKKLADTSKKTARKHPKKTRRRAEKATDRVLRATEQALAGTERQSHEDAVQESTEAVAPAATAATGPDELSLLTVAQLRDRARSQGRVGYSRLSKADLIEFLA